MENTSRKVPKIPGQLIAAELESRGWSNRVLAIVLGINEASVTKLISGKQAVKADLALSLEEVFGIAADEFLELQKNFDLAQAKIIQQPDPDRATRAVIFGDLPISVMIKRGWIDAKNLRDKDNIETGLKKLFKAKKITDIVDQIPFAAKQTVESDLPTAPQLAWLYRVKAIASEMIVANYTKRTAEAAVRKLSSLLLSAEEIRKVPRILAEAGIRFVIVESLPSAKIDGVCLWLDDNSPVIGMSLRYDRIDNFWFVLRHELEHVIHGHGKGLQTGLLDASLEGERAGTGTSVAEEERIANKAAADFCVPQKQLDALIARKSPFFSESDIIGFSRTIGVHPGLVAGQIQRHTGRYNIFRSHLVKVRSKIKSNAAVDGWGDVYPLDDF